MAMEEMDNVLSFLYRVQNLPALMGATGETVDISSSEVSIKLSHFQLQERQFLSGASLGFTTSFLYDMRTAKSESNGHSGWLDT